jgi:hypothetical protein
MSEKDPWQCYGPPEMDDGSWIVLGAEIIPLPAHKCPDKCPDWIVKGLPKEPIPHDMPVFMIDQIITMQNGRKRAIFYMVDAPLKRASRDVVDIKEKWRPAPPPLQDEPIVESVVLSRYKRPPVI